MIGQHAPDSVVALVASATPHPTPGEETAWFRRARTIADEVWSRAWADGHCHGLHDATTPPPAAL